jgi:hypothetical protein
MSDSKIEHALRKAIHLWRTQKCYTGTDVHSDEWYEFISGQLNHELTTAMKKGPNSE